MHSVTKLQLWNSAASASLQAGNFMHSAMGPDQPRHSAVFMCEITYTACTHKQHTNIHTYMHTYIHTYMCIYIYIHVCVQYAQNACAHRHTWNCIGMALHQVHTYSTYITNKQTYIHTHMHTAAPYLTLHFITYIAYTACIHTLKKCNVKLITLRYTTTYIHACMQADA